MRIEISNKGPRSYYNEIAYIKLNYSKVLNSPEKPAKTVTSYVMTRVIGFLAVLGVAGYLYQNTKDVIYGAIFIALVVAVAAVILSLVSGIMKMNSLMAEDGPRAIEVDEKGIRSIEGEKINELSWDDILCIAINKHSIAVLPKEVPMYGIYCSLEYKDQLVSAIRQSGHFYMIEDNVTVNK